MGIMMMGVGIRRGQSQQNAVHPLHTQNKCLNQWQTHFKMRLTHKNK